MQVYNDQDINLSLLSAKTVAVIGYGNQGRAQALNLKDSGVNVIVGTRENSATKSLAEREGFMVTSVKQAASEADIVVMLAPDESQQAIYDDVLESTMSPNSALVFAHGFNIHYQLIKPRKDIDIILVSPKGPGHLLRSTYLENKGLAALIGVAQDVSGQARDLALSFAGALGSGRCGILETSFQQEVETDLFGEQAVLCGGAMELVKAGFETLVDAGYAPEMAYFECLHELKLVVDLLQKGGLGYVSESISNTAEYGAITRGKRVINAESRQAMQQILAEVRSGQFCKEFILETQTGKPMMNAQRRNLAEHTAEITGKQLRELMAWD